VRWRHPVAFPRISGKHKYGSRQYGCIIRTFYNAGLSDVPCAHDLFADLEKFPAQLSSTLKSILEVEAGIAAVRSCLYPELFP